MNIQQAKIQIRNAVRAYLTKDAFGSFRIPHSRQRPLFLMGPPGIGKTAAVKQAAEELSVGFVSYTMTCHTRQSVLGLPYIERKILQGKNCAVSAYTMSELLAEVYAEEKRSGKKEGILFLDEINCVSDTLSPVLLQFLQNKTLAGKRLPAGWIIIAAGNPPEYNASARHMDIAAWDRFRRIDITPDYSCFREYAEEQGIHPAILSYLDGRPHCFYQTVRTQGRQQFVTARSWMDLSDMLMACDRAGWVYDFSLMAQYLQIHRTAEDFLLHARLWRKYQEDFRLQDILAGNVSGEVLHRVEKAGLDERLHLLDMLTDQLKGELQNIFCTEQAFAEVYHQIAALRQEADPETACKQHLTDLRLKTRLMQMTAGLSPERKKIGEEVLSFWEETGQQMSKAWCPAARMVFEGRRAALENQVERTGKRLSALFSFCEKVFGEGEEISILEITLTRNRFAACFLAYHGEQCPAYFAHAEALRFDKREEQLLLRAESLTT